MRYNEYRIAAESSRIVDRPRKMKNQKADVGCTAHFKERYRSIDGEYADGREGFRWVGGADPYYEYPFDEERNTDEEDDGDDRGPSRCRGVTEQGDSDLGKVSQHDL